MQKKWKKLAGILCGGILLFGAGAGTGSVLAEKPITLWLNGTQIQTDTEPIIINGRTMVPIRVISEYLNMDVKWDGDERKVLLTGNVPAPQNRPNTVAEPSFPPLEAELNNTTAEPVNTEGTPMVQEPSLNAEIGQPIKGKSVATAEQLQRLAWMNNPEAPDVAQYYLELGEKYGIRGDVAFCQAAKETGWWKYGNLVKAYQHNYCGLGATGTAATGEESLNGANPARVWYIAGIHGAIFATERDGVEAQLQHLYAYCCTDPLPEGCDIVDPRFTLVSRGIAANWQDLNGRWAVPGVGYGESIFNDYYAKVFQ